MMEKTEWILDCSIEKFLKIIGDAMQLFEDAEQSAGNENKPQVEEFITDSFNKLDDLYHKVKDTRKVSCQERNRARMNIKETYKLIISEELPNVNFELETSN